ncbi:hypothetical protein OUZ56_016703 [Daphnia magna]|uniref:Uncharacterized protein n=1 Tax=Daphnia magna TaxID=35525 RepID=A0ABR0ARD3_9CRUS|nr:hypothetical protein OUZ56_016703 [Daphnia magna]
MKKFRLDMVEQLSYMVRVLPRAVDCENGTKIGIVNIGNSGRFKRGSPIRAYVKVGPLVTHPARVAKKDDSNFCPTFTLSSTRTI